MFLPIIGIIIAFLVHLLFTWFSNLAINGVPYAIQLGIYQFQMLQSLIFVFSYIAPFGFFVYFFKFGVAITKREGRYLTLLILASAEVLPLDLDELKDAIEKRKQPLEHNRYVIFLASLLGSLLLIWFFMFILVLFGVLAEIAEYIGWNTDFFYIGVFVSWLLLFTFYHKLFNIKFYYETTLYRGLYATLFILFLSALVVNNINLDRIYALYNPLESYYQNAEIQKRLSRLMYHYSELVIQWSMVQGIVFTILDRKMSYKKINEKVRKEEIEEDRDAEEFLIEAILLDRFENEVDENRDNLMEYMLCLYRNPDHYKTIKSINNFDMQIASLPSFHLKENEAERLTVFFDEMLPILLDKNDETFANFVKDKLFHKQVISYLNAQKMRGRLKVCAVTSCKKLFMSVEDEHLCMHCREWRNTNSLILS